MNYSQLNATTQVKTSAARLCSLTVSSTTSGTITIYDEAQGGTTRKVLATITPAAGATYWWGEEGLATTNGLYIVVANTIEFTVGWK